MSVRCPTVLWLPPPDGGARDLSQVHSPFALTRLAIFYYRAGKPSESRLAMVGNAPAKIWNNAALRNLYSVRDNYAPPLFAEFSRNHGGQAKRSSIGIETGHDRLTAENGKRQECKRVAEKYPDLARERKGRRARAHQWRPPTLIYSNQNGRPSTFRTYETFHAHPVLSWRGSSVQ